MFKFCLLRNTVKQYNQEALLRDSVFALRDHVPINVLSMTPPDPYVSPPRDPTALNCLLYSTNWKKLRTLSEKKARHNSHLHRESYWIFQLAILAPSGININD